MAARGTLGVGLLLLGAAALISAFAFYPGSRPAPPATPAVQAPPTPAATPTPAASPTPTPEPERYANSSGALPARVTIPGPGIDGPVVIGELNEAGDQMVAPDPPDVVAWYEYSAIPGRGGNSVFAGHVDRAGYGPAVLWDLRHVSPGDRLLVELEDGVVLTYLVESNEVYHVEDGPWGQLFSPRAGDDILTLYTCDGELIDGSYKLRRVVRASLDSATAAPAP